jgi:hypothetical protein
MVFASVLIVFINACINGLKVCRYSSDSGFMNSIIKMFGEGIAEDQIP